MSNAPSSSTCLVYNFSGGSTMNNECFKMSNLKKIREKNNITKIRVSIDLEVYQEQKLESLEEESKKSDFINFIRNSFGKKH